MPFAAPPPFAAWAHQEARSGFEVVFLRLERGALAADGTTTAVEAGAAWTVTYAVALDAGGRTRRAEVTSRSAGSRHEVVLEADGAGAWLVDGRPAPRLDGCLDVDLESSALTNAFPVHRLGLAVGEPADAPAAYVRALDLRVERLDQRYARLEDAATGPRYHYAAPAFGFECELVYDRHGLVVEYPGLATRAA